VGAAYEIQVTTNWTVWITLTNLVAAGTQTSYLDTTSATLQPIRFYRIRTTSGGSGGSTTNLPPVSLEVPLVIHTNGWVQLAWESVVGAVYTVQYSTNLMTWSSLTNLVATATHSVFTDPTVASESLLRFYRLLLPP
jgi:hypothetical protein